MANSSWRSETWYKELYHHTCHEVLWGWEHHAAELALADEAERNFDLHSEAWVDNLMEELHHWYLHRCKEFLVSLRKCTEYSQATIGRGLRFLKEYLALPTGSDIEADHDDRFPIHLHAVLLGTWAGSIESLRGEELSCPKMLEHVPDLPDLDPIRLHFWNRTYPVDSIELFGAIKLQNWGYKMFWRNRCSIYSCRKWVKDLDQCSIAKPGWAGWESA